jgi:50S ribosomal protein L16 3-hydroxylase
MRSHRALDCSAPASPLGSIGIERFMRQYWQKKPLLVRQALPGFQAPVQPASLRELASRDDVESRIVSRRAGRWRLQRGPFEPQEIPSPRSRQWTLLVQGVDLHVQAAHDLLRRFRFIGDARLDDLMISWAGDGGGVGPHVDSYDVFLLQAQGRRQWRIAPPAPANAPAEWVPGVPLKLLARFEPTEQWILEPGDMLYLPPGWGHDGQALGECMTYSIGFRAPSRHEFLVALLADLADAPAGADPRFRDPGRAPTATPGRLAASLDRQLQDWARQWRPDPNQVRRFIGRWLTEPKPNVWFEGPSRHLGAQAFATRAQRHRLCADRKTRMTYRGRDFFINGECFAGANHRLLRELADRRELSGAHLASAIADPLLGPHLHQWWDQGWLVIETQPAGPDH